MEALLLAIYATIVWLIFFKFKLLPWTTAAKVIVVTIPVVGMITLILLLNVFAPSSGDVIVIRNSVGIVSQVKGRVVEVPVHINQRVKQGDVLFKIDSTQYQAQVNSIKAKLDLANAWLQRVLVIVLTLRRHKRIYSTFKNSSNMRNMISSKRSCALRLTALL
jgi:multidrug resistance efflux pump